MSGTFSIHHQPVVTLFDFGATHSFISNNCGTQIGLDLCPTQGSYMISTPEERSLPTKWLEVCQFS
jgi:hypothetical protein